MEQSDDGECWALLLAHEVWCYQHWLEGLHNLFGIWEVGLIQGSDVNGPLFFFYLNEGTQVKMELSLKTWIKCTWWMVIIPLLHIIVLVHCRESWVQACCAWVWSRGRLYSCWQLVCNETEVSSFARSTMVGHLGKLVEWFAKGTVAKVHDACRARMCRAALNAFFVMYPRQVQEGCSANISALHVEYHQISDYRWVFSSSFAFW